MSEKDETFIAVVQTCASKLEDMCAGVGFYDDYIELRRGDLLAIRRSAEILRQLAAKLIKEKEGGK